MKKNDNLFNIVIDKNQELLIRLSELSFIINSIHVIKQSAQNKGHWNENYVKDLLKKFVFELSFSVEEIQFFIEDEILTLRKHKNEKNHFSNTLNQLPN